MANKSVTYDVVKGDFNKLLSEIEEYQKDLERKGELMLKKLGEVGIMVAKTNAGVYGQFITFGYRIEGKSDDKIVAVFYGTNNGNVTVDYGQADGSIKSVDISPIAFAEFGSGWESEDNSDGLITNLTEPVGQGTFPNQIHAKDPNGWSYMTKDGTWHHTYGIKPTEPLHKAYMQMYLNIQKVAREVFG